MTTSTDLDDTLANIRARTEAATDSQWEQEWWRCHAEGYFRASMGAVPDLVAYFTTLTPSAVLELLDLLDEQRAVIARVREICAEPDDTQWWPVQPYMDPPNEDEVVEVQVIAADRLLVALDGADTTTTEGSEA